MVEWYTRNVEGVVLLEHEGSNPSKNIRDVNTSVKTTKPDCVPDVSLLEFKVPGHEPWWTGRILVGHARL